MGFSRLEVDEGKMSKRQKTLFKVFQKNPLATNAELAAMTGYSKGYISRMRNTDLFKTVIDGHYESVQGMARIMLVDKGSKVSEELLSVLLKKIQMQGTLMSVGDAAKLMKAIKPILEVAGVGDNIPIQKMRAKEVEGKGINNNITFNVDQSILEDARNSVLKLAREGDMNGQTIEHMPEVGEEEL